MATQRRRSTPVHPLVLALALALAGPLGCRTTRDGSETAGAAVAGEGFATTLRLAKTEEQALYLLMLQVELDAGAKVAKDRLHSVAGIATCSRAALPLACDVRVRLGARELSASQPLARETAEKIAAFVHGVRPELEADKVVHADVTCDYLGKKSPPYDIEDVTCLVSHARATNEAVFVDPAAEELADLLRGDQSFGTGEVSLHGTIACRQVDGSPRRACVVRAAHKGVLAEKVSPLSARNAGGVATLLFQTVSDVVRLEGRGAPAVVPREVAGSLTCVVDSSRYETEGRRRTRCRAGL